MCEDKAFFYEEFPDINFEHFFKGSDKIKKEKFKLGLKKNNQKNSNRTYFHFEFSLKIKNITSENKEN